MSPSYDDVIRAYQVAIANFPEPKELHPYRKVKGQNGRKIHRDQGFCGCPRFEKEYIHLNGGKKSYLVSGTPDIYVEAEKDGGGKVGEFKTFKAGLNGYREIQRNRAKVQAIVYGWLTGIPNLEVQLYDIDQKLVVETVTLTYDEEMFRNFMETAINVLMSPDSD